MKNNFFKYASMIMVILLILGATIYTFIRPQTPAPTVSMIQETVKEYLMENPDIVIEAIHKYQENESVSRQESAKASIDENYDALINDGHSAILGNPEGDITVVEFFDYSCGYCKRAFPNVVELIAKDKNVRVVMKEFPILGANSTIAAKAAMATQMIAPEKYLELHAKLMEGRLSGESAILDLVEQVGLDRAKVKEKMESDEVSNALESNVAQAQSIGVEGTPAFLIGKTLVPGAIDYSAMKSLVAQERQKNAQADSQE